MKKITDNTKIGNLTVIANVLVFLFLIISMVQLMKFDKINVQYVTAMPTYEKALDALRMAEQPTRSDSATVAHYQYRVDTLNAKEMPKDKKAAQTLKDDIARVSGILKEKQDIKAHNDSIVKVRRAEYTPLETSYQELETESLAAKKTFKVFYILTFILLIAKIVVFAFWNYKNLNNVRLNTTWGKKGTSPYWAFLGWIIPVYNFIKPYSIVNEIFNDTEYMLIEKGALPEDYDHDDYNDFYVGLWWGFFLLAVGIGSLFINSTFFETSALYQKLSHFNVMFCVLLLWLVYLFLESLIIYRFNKMNKVMTQNQK